MKGHIIFLDRNAQCCQWVLPNLNYEFNVIPIKISARYFVDIVKLILKFKWQAKKNPEQSKGEQSCKVDTVWLQDSLKSYSNQDSMVLVLE
jgi:hypothetical protein